MAGGGGGLGPVLHMINTLRSNRELLKRPTRFNKRGKHFFDKDREDYLTGPKGKINIQPVSKEKLEEYKARNKKERVKEKKRLVILSIITFIILSIVSVQITISSIKEHRKMMTLKENQRKVANNKIKEKYQFFLNDGDKWLNERNYYNAIFQYKLAIETGFNDKEVRKRLMYTYCLQCQNEMDSCDVAINELKKSITKYPEEAEFYEYIIQCKEFKNDTSGTGIYYRTLERLTDLKNK